MTDTDPHHQDYQPDATLREFRERRDRLILRLEKQSDVGQINVDEVLALYSREYDQPIWNLLQDIQTQIEVYHNAFEELKSSRSEDVARQLKERYQDIGLIPRDNRWPNPIRDWLMNIVLDKLKKYRKAMVDIVRTRGRPLIAELNFEPTLAVGFQLSIGTDTSFTLTIQPELTAAQRA